MSDHFYGVASVGSGVHGSTPWAAYGRNDSDLAPVLLIHGLSDSSACWPGVVERLSQTRLVIVTDLPGHGNAPLPDELWSIQGMTDALAALVRGVVQRPVVLIGHSLGGLVGIDFALRAPDMTAGLVLEDPALDLRGGGAAALALTDAVSEMLAHVRTTSYVSMITLGRKENPNWSDDEFAPWALAKTQLDPGLAALPHTLADDDWLEALANMAPSAQFPVALIAGDPDEGSFVSIADGARAAELLAERGKVFRVDAGHCVRRDNRARFLEILDEVLLR